MHALLHNGFFLLKSICLQQKGWGSDYGTSFILSTAEVEVVCGEIVIQNKSIIANCWNSSTENTYNSIIDESIKLKRWFDIKA